MELTTFGSALKFAIDLENMAMEVFAYAAGTACSEESMRSFMEFSASSRTRKLLMEKQYSENVYSDMDTGIFEPLPVIHGELYITNPQPSAKAGASTFLKEAIEMEEKIRTFYLDLASRMRTRRRGVAKAYDKMAKENLERISRLSSLIQVLISS